MTGEEKQLLKLKQKELENLDVNLKDSIYRKVILEKKIDKYNIFKEFLEQVSCFELWTLL